MNRPLALLTALVSMGPPTLADSPRNVPPKGFIPLFNGKDFENWRGLQPDTNPYKLAEKSKEDRAKMQARDNEEMAKHWRVENGELINDGVGPYLATVKDYRNFELFVDWKIVPKGDSGVYLRGTPQVQIWDTTEAGGKWAMGAKFGSGSLWNNKKSTNRALVHADNPPGQWNTFHITMKGDRVTVELNGKRVVDNLPLDNYWNPDKPLSDRGPIELQTHGGVIQWRNIFLRELPDE